MRGEAKIIDAQTGASGASTEVITHHSGQVAITIVASSATPSFVIAGKASKDATAGKVYSTTGGGTSSAGLLPMAFADGSSGISLSLPGNMYSYTVNWLGNSGGATINAWAYVGDES